MTDKIMVDKPVEPLYSFNSGIIRKCEYFDLFISYKRDNGGDHGQKLAIELHDKLTKDGFKVWLDNEEIGFSNNFEQRIEQALLHSKKVACIMGPEWVESLNCRFEVQKAIEFEKRIIPIHYQEFRALLASKKNEGVLSEKEWLRIDRPQEIDFSIPAKHKAGYEDLKSVCKLHDDITLQFNKILSESYYWDKHNRPKSMLLSGTRLSKTKLLKSKCNSDEELPSFSDLQNEFIEASEHFVKTEVTDKKKVYISFTEDETDYALELNMELKLHGITTYFDEDFTIESDAQTSYIDPILNCETVLDVATKTFPGKNDVRLNFARSNNKRILKVTDSELTQKKLDSEGATNIHVWNDQLSIDGLIILINGDKAYNIFHSKLLGQAYEWENNEKTDSKLLALQDAEKSKDWYKNAEKRALEPQPSLAMINFVERSLVYAETSRKKRIFYTVLASVALAAIVVLGLGIYIAKEDIREANDKIEQANAKTKQANLDKEQAKKDTDNANAKTEQANLDKEQANAKTEQANLDKEQAKKDTKEAKAKTEIANTKTEIANIDRKEAEAKTEIAKADTEIAKADTEIAKKILETTNSKTKAAKLSLDAYDLVRDGKYLESQLFADSAFKIYKDIKNDYETDVLYRTYYSIYKSYSELENIPADTTYSDEKDLTNRNLLFKELNIKLEDTKHYTIKFHNDSSHFGAIGLNTGKIILFKKLKEHWIQTDIISIGKNRVTSIDFNKNGDQMIASSVDLRFTIIPLTKSGKRNKKKQLIRIQSLKRIEKIRYIKGGKEIAAIEGKKLNDKRSWTVYPATVEELHNILKLNTESK